MIINSSFSMERLKFDTERIPPDTTWTASIRGICLVTEITAIVKTPSGDIAATPYVSLGSSDSRFAIIQTGENQFKVTYAIS